MDAASIAKHPPVHAADALDAGGGRKTVLVVSVDAEGGIQDIAIASSAGRRSLDRAAIEAARTWRYRPAEVDCAPAPGRVRIPVDRGLPH